jgi:group I intron endonuclease
MPIYSIYKSINKVNGKVYIGFASNLPKRKYRHKHYALAKKRTNRFYTAIRKYGWENFEWQIIYQSKDKNHCLNIMENFFIEEYRTYIGFDDCNGYNMTLGGDGGLGSHRPKTKEHRERISQSHKGKKLSQEHILNAAQARSKEYLMISPNGDTLHIKNMSEYCRKNGLNQSHMISVCLGRYGFLSHKGYRKYE